MKKPELLAPAGNLDKLKIAFLYGADAVYIGGEEFSLRAAADNFTMDEIQEGVKFAHERGKKVYLTANIIPHNADLKDYRSFISDAAKTGIDAVIVSDLGLFSITREIAPMQKSSKVYGQELLLIFCSDGTCRPIYLQIIIMIGLWNL